MPKILSEGAGMSSQHEGVGITHRELAAGTAVMVPVGKVSTIVNGGPCVIAWAVVVGPVDENGMQATYWLDVYITPSMSPLRQMYRVDEILGVPALGLRMDGAPDPDNHPSGGSSESMQDR